MKGDNDAAKHGNTTVLSASGGIQGVTGKLEVGNSEKPVSRVVCSKK
jgi:hypothetical protein